MFRKRHLWRFYQWKMNKLDTIFDVIQEMREHFGWQETDTIDFIKQCIVEESHELLNATDNIEMKHELADVLMYALTLTKLMDVDVLDIINEKAKIVMKRSYD